ncbi:MAG: penicillin-binding protein 2 [Flavobacteriales bacterium]|nr:penicillin-binding protein 2 [Flavobacteriales bacterium]
MNLSDRKYVILIIFAFVALLFIGKLFFIQIINDDWKKKAAHITESARTIYPARGIVYDRNGKIIVDNIAAFDLMVLPKQLKEFDTLKLADLTDLSVEDIKERIAKATKYSRYKASEFLTQISGNDFVPIKESLSEFPGFFSRDRTLRAYPYNAAPHIFGYVGEVSQKTIDDDPYYRSGDYIGTSGIEKSYETALRGKRGVEYVLVDVFNNVKGKYNNGAYDTVSVNGLDLISTIDIELQAYGERLMENKRGSIVAIEPSTGEVLCIVNNPDYDPNLLVGRIRSKNYRMLRNDTLKPLFNRALQAQYPPGSTFKLIQALIGLQDGTLDLNTYYSCNGGYFFGRRRLGCHSHRSPVGLNYSISTSCNAYYCNVFKDYLDSHSNTEEGYLNWRNYLSKFGIGNKLGIDLPSEQSGILKEPSFYDKYYGKGVWKPHTIISLAIGQGELGVTPLQMANYASAIANRGWFKTPHVVKRVGSNADQKFDKRETGIKEEHFETVVNGMYSVIEEGTGRGVRFSEDIEVCGKTGTAQNPFGKDHSIFIAFAPKDDPKIAVAVYVENVGFGSTWAAPINSLIMEKYLTRTTNRPRVEKKMLEADLLYN